MTSVPGGGVLGVALVGPVLRHRLGGVDAEEADPFAVAGDLDDDRVAVHDPFDDGVWGEVALVRHGGRRRRVSR